MNKVLIILIGTVLASCGSLPNDWDISRMDGAVLHSDVQYDYIRDPHSGDILYIIEKSR